MKSSFLVKLLIIAFMLYSPSWAFGAGVEGVSKTYPRGLSAIDSPSDGECFAFDSTTNRGEWVSCGGGTPNLQDLPGAVTDAQVPNTITIDSASSVEGTDLGTLTDGKICVYDLANTEIDCNYTDQTGAGGGDEVSIDGAGVTNPNFASTGDIDFVDTSNTVTANLNADVVDFGDIKFDNTLAGNPALLVDECYFLSTTTGGGFICEGSTADTSEQLYMFPDNNGADTTQTIAIVDETQTLTNKTLSASNNVIEADTGDSATSFFNSGTIGAERLPDADDDASTKGIATWADADVDCTTGSCSIASAITRDAEWDTIAEINTASTDADIIATNSSWSGGDLTGTGLSATITTNAVALTTDTTGNYVGNVATDVLTGLTGGSAGSEGASLSVGFDYSQGMSGNVGLGASATVFGTNGIVSEGSTANTIEGFITFPNWATSDKTIAFPDASGTVAVSASSPVALSAGGDISITGDGIGTTQIDETANYTFSGTVTNDGTNPTCDASGEICEDTTNSQLVVGNGNVFDKERTVCVTIPDVVSTDDNFNFFMANEAITVTSVGCRYEGTGTTVATFALEDNSGNAMTHSSPTCVTSTNSATYQSVSSGGGLVAGEGLRLDTTNTPNPTTDDYTLCVVYTVDRQ